LAGAYFFVRRPGAPIRRAAMIHGMQGRPDDVRAFHRSLPGYAPTPVHDLGGGVRLKDESARLGLPAFKILGASWAAERAIGPDTRMLVAASAGNHGRAVARVAAWRGLACRVFLPARSLPARRTAIASEGAEVVVVDGSYEDAVRLAAGEGRRPGVVEIADVGTSQTAHDVIDGYATLFAEAAEQAGPFDAVLVPVGVGSLAAAAARHGAATGAEVVGVEPETAACLTAALAAGRPVTIETPGTTMAGMDCAEVSEAAWPDLRAGIARTVLVGDAQVAAAMAELEERGIVVGECGAAAYAALAHARVEGRILLVATEGRL
jgi:diaminopropionate ammonia-lyase